MKNKTQASSQEANGQGPIVHPGAWKFAQAV